MKHDFPLHVAAQGGGYILGVCNINLYKQGMLLLAVGQGREDLQGWTTLCFGLPFVLLSAWAGRLADRFPKKHVALAAKILELAAATFGAWALVRGDWGFMLPALFCFGAGSALCCPAVHGGIPEHFTAEALPKVNAVFNLGVTLGMLAGTAAAGAALDMAASSRLPLAGAVMLTALLGLAVAFLMPFHPAPTVSPDARDGAKPRLFPRPGLPDAPRHFLRLRTEDPALFSALAANAFFFFISGLALLAVNALGRGELGLGNTRTSLLPAALSLGLCGGALLAARFAAPESWRRLLVPTCVGLGLALLAVGPAARLPEAACFPTLITLHILMGLCGGLYLIPLASFIQLRPAPDGRGRVLGTDNWLIWTGVLLGGPVYLGLERFAPSTGFMILGGVTLAAAAGFAPGFAKSRATCWSRPRSA